MAGTGRQLIFLFLYALATLVGAFSSVYLFATGNAIAGLWAMLYACAMLQHVDW